MPSKLHPLVDIGPDKIPRHSWLKELGFKPTVYPFMNHPNTHEELDLEIKTLNNILLQILNNLVKTLKEFVFMQLIIKEMAMYPLAKVKRPEYVILHHDVALNVVIYIKNRIMW